MNHPDEKVQKRTWDGKIEVLVVLLATEAARVYGLNEDNTIRALNFLVCGGGKSRKFRNETPLVHTAKDFREYMHGRNNALGRLLVASYNRTPLQDELKT